MHYFKRNIGDYHKKAGRLSMLEHGAYTLLLDAYYDREQAPTKQEAIDWCWARSPEEIAAVEFLLSKFFTLEGDVYIQTRIEEELANYTAKSLVNKRIAKEREANKRAQKARTVHEPSPDKHETAPNHKPLTTNQEPRTKENPIVAGKPPTCPHQDIINLYHLHLPTSPAVKDWTPARQTKLRARWNENKQRQNLDYWSKLFQYISGCDFLTGRTEKPFTPNLEWIITPSNLTKIVEGNYDNK